MRRRHLSPVTAGLSTAAALLLLAGCGDDGGGTADDGGSAATNSVATSSSSGGTVADADPFCTEAVDAGNDLDTLFTNAGEDLTQLPALLEEAADRFGNIQAPAPIAADWATLTDGITQLATAAQGVDFADQTQVTAFEQSVSALEAPLTSAQDNVSSYLSDQCGIDPGTGATVAPSS